MSRRTLSSILASLLLPLFVVPQTAVAWTPEGHEVICTLAWSLLDEPTRTEIDRLVAVLASVPPEARDLPSACSWLDWVRQQGLGHFDRWHYVNLPLGLGDRPPPPLPTDNVIFAIEESMDSLRDPATSDFGRAFALRVLVHAVGDVHQPLHTVSRYGPTRPDGDRGGNDFAVAGDEHLTNLHFLWDHGVGLLSHPQTEAERRGAAKALAQELRRDVELTPGELDEADPRRWAEEGRRLAQEVVYRGLEEGDRPSAEYVARAQPVARRQLALAGHRLARLLESLLASPEA